MSATLIRDFAKQDTARLSAVLADLLNLPEQLTLRRAQLFRDAALNDRAQELHDGRDEYHRIYDDYIGVAGRFQTLAETAGSELAADFARVGDALRRQRDELFGRWKTFDDICEILIEHIQPSAEKLRELAERFPPPQSWYDETDDPFQPQE